MKKPEITWIYYGTDKKYRVFLNTDCVHVADNEYDRDMFIAELKLKDFYFEQKQKQNN